MGPQMLPGLTTKSTYYNKIHYAVHRNIRSFYIECSDSKKADFLKLQALEILFDSKLNRYTVICGDESLFQLFEQIFIEIFHFMEDKRSSFQEAYNEIIEKYAAFLQEMQYLGKEKQIGLLAELLFLEELLKIDKKALKYWIDANEDFKVKSNYVEVKATRSKEHKHIISGLNQLTILPDTKKFLASYLVEDHDSFKARGSINLYSQTKSLLKTIPTIDRPKFLKKLEDRKYFHKYNGVEYEEFNFKFYDPIYAEVNASFPKLDNKSVKSKWHGNIPPDEVKYLLNLESLLSLFSKINKLNLKKDLF